MKKLLAILMALMMVVSVFTACGEEEKKPAGKNDNKAPVVSSDNVDNVSEEAKDNAPSVDLPDEEAPSVDSSKNAAIPAVSEDAPEESVVVSEGEYDSALIGSWTTTEDDMTMVFTFDEEGKGEINADGLVADMEWYVADGKLTVVMVMYGMTDTMVEDADYSVNGEELSITFEGETVVFTKGSVVEDETSVDVNVNAEYDSILLGTWALTEDDVELIVTFEENGEGTINVSGMPLDLIWYTYEDKLTASMSFMGESEDLFADAEYTVDVDQLFITVEGETLTLTKYDSESNGDEEVSFEINTVKEYDSAVLGTWTADDDGTSFTFTFEEEGVGFVTIVDETEELSFYIDWYTSDGMLDTVMTEMNGVEINEPFGTFEYELNGEALELTLDGDLLVFEKV